MTHLLVNNILYYVIQAKVRPRPKRPGLDAAYNLIAFVTLSQLATQQSHECCCLIDIILVDDS